MTYRLLGRPHDQKEVYWRKNHEADGGSLEESGHRGASHIEKPCLKLKLKA